MYVHNPTRYHDSIADLVKHCIMSVHPLLFESLEKTPNQAQMQVHENAVAMLPRLVTFIGQRSDIGDMLIASKVGEKAYEEFVKFPLQALGPGAVHVRNSRIYRKYLADGVNQLLQLLDLARLQRNPANGAIVNNVPSYGQTIDM